MTINLNIKVNVDNLTLAEIYELLEKCTRETKNKDNFYEFKGKIFKIETQTNMSINYIITEII
jgi:methionine aminopeptidase